MNEDNTKDLSTTPAPSLAGLSWLYRALRVFTDVRRSEGLNGVIMLAGVFLILTAYCLFKPAREGRQGRKLDRSRERAPGEGFVSADLAQGDGHPSCV